MEVIVHRYVLPDFCRHIERPDLIGHRRIRQYATVHEYLVAKEYARMSVARQRNLTLDVRGLPDVSIEIINVDHFCAMKALTADYV